MAFVRYKSLDAPGGNREGGEGVNVLEQHQQSTDTTVIISQTHSGLTAGLVSLGLSGEDRENTEKMSIFHLQPSAGLC